MLLGGVEGEHKMLIFRYFLIPLLFSSLAQGVPIRKTNLCYKNITQPTTRCLLHLSPPTFLDLELPYRSIALPEYIPGLNVTADEIIRYSQRWLEVKRTLPKCWPYLQVALTSIFMPRCDEDPDTGHPIRIYQPSYDICNDLVNKNNCNFLERHYGWLPMFNCSDSNLYNRNCTNDLRELKTSTDSCKYPLVPSSDSKLWFKDVTGCAMHCKYPIMDPLNHHQISFIIALFGLMGLTSTSLAVLLYSVYNGKSSRMAKVTKQCTWCQLANYIGWLLQFVYSQDIACSLSGAPLPGNKGVCVVTFFLTYVPTLASLLWCCYLAKLCFEKLTGIKKRDSKGTADIDKNIYVFCYGIPFGLFVIVALMSEIESHGLYGVCTVGQQSNVVIKFIFLHTPTFVGVLYENFYFTRTFFKLNKAKNKKESLIRNLVRIATLASLSTIHLISSIGRQIYELRNHERLFEGVDKYLACGLNLEKINEYDDDEFSKIRSQCTIPDTKSMVTIYYIELASSLSIGIIIASWALYEPNFLALRRKLVDLLKDEKDLQRKFYQRANSGVVAEFELTYHDAIDVTTPTRSKAKEINLDEVAGQSLRQNLDVDAASSLGSTSILSNGGTLQQAYRNPRFKHKNVGFNRTSRDVINDQRQLQEQSTYAAQECELPPIPPMPELTGHLAQLLLAQLAAASVNATTAAAPGVDPPSFNSIQPSNRPPWTDKNETPQFDFTHGVAARCDVEHG